jgi:hypothetical protein
MEETEVYVAWDELEDAILQKYPEIAPYVKLLKRHWPKGVLVTTAERLLSAYWSGNYVEAKNILYQSSETTADDLIGADREANAALSQMLLYNVGVLRALNEFWVMLFNAAIAAAIQALLRT